jgi:protein-S-isoprenylcysteine O-methyltransferase Ste14
MALKARTVGVFIITLAIYLGFPWLGWSLGGSTSFFITPQRTAFGLGCLAFATLIGVQAYHSMEGIQDSPGQPGKTIHRQTVIGGLMTGLLLITMFAVPFASQRVWGSFTAASWIGWVGAALTWLGYLLVYSSGKALGRQYSAEITLQQDHELITSGPYRWVRHPRYLGILCLGLGIGLVFASWIGLVVTALVSGLIGWRIADEEALLALEFGQIGRAHV